MKERPILFSGSMVQAILDDRKTQTRRVIKPQPTYVCTDWSDDAEIGDIVMYRGMPHRLTESRGRNKAAAGELTPSLIKCPYGKIGDLLWVRETWSTDDGRTFWYRADGETYNAGLPWRPSIHMPRWASRIQLEITGVRVERIQDISEADVKAEGCEYLAYRCADEMRPNDPSEFSDLWDMINEKRGFGWAVNPWVWVVEFKRI